MTLVELVNNLMDAKNGRAAFAVIISFAAHWIGPISHFIVAALVLLLFDWITGVRAATLRGEKITSRGFFRTLEKGVHYMLAIVLSHMVENVFIPYVPATYIVASYVAMTEFKSNLENISSITGTNIGSSLKKVFSRFLKNNNNEGDSSK